MDNLNYWELRSDLGFYAEKITSSSVIVKHQFSNERKEFPVFKHTRKEMLSLIKEEIISKLKVWSAEDIYNNFDKIKPFIITSETEKYLRNYEIEELYFTLFLEYGHYINEPCPSNGKYSAYGDINGLI